MAEIKELFFKTREELSNWFIKNYEQENSFNMLFYKKHIKTKCIEYSDAVEEALCFGWIDGMIKRLDEDKYIRRFSKRNRKSRWSPTNIKRLKMQLIFLKMRKRMDCFKQNQIGRTLWTFRRY